MLDLTPALLAHLASGNTTLAVCWRIERRDGALLRYTQHDRSLDVSLGSPDPFDLSGSYQAERNISGSSINSASDLSVSNMEVQGALELDYTFDGINAADLEAGLFDSAAFFIFQVNWADPSSGVIPRRRGTIGNIKRDSDGRWSCELRSLGHALQQSTGRSYGVLCDANLGDARCGVDLNAFTGTGVVISANSRRVFSALIDVGSPSVAAGFFQYGLLTFNTGANAGYSREVASDTGGEIELFEGFPNAIAEDDTFSITAGCNKEHNIAVEMSGDDINPNGPPTVANGRVTGDCEVKFLNSVNFRGFPNKPGPDTLIRLRTPPKKGGGGGGKK